LPSLSLEPAPIRVGGIAIIALLTLIARRTWEDKSFYLSSHSPASAACLREWRTARVESGVRLFQWSGGAPPFLLGEPLELRHLSVFGSRRIYLLQGDAAAGRVNVETPDLPAFLSRDGRTPGDPNDSHRLDLVIAPGASVAWRVDLPPKLKSARFLTRVRAAPGDPKLGRGARVSVTAERSTVVLDERTFLPRETAQPLSVDLSSLAGKHVTLRLATEETQEDGTPLVFEVPRVLLTLDPGLNRRTP
jgi:hypothetical protein